MAWPLVALSGLLDPNVYVPGYVPTGTDVGADISAVLNKTTELVDGANELKVGLDAEVAAGLVRDGTLAAHQIVIQTNIDNIATNVTAIALNTTHRDDETGADHAELVTGIATNADDIDTLENLVGVGQLVTTSDESTFSYSNFGGYGQIVLNDQSAKQIWGMNAPAGQGWPLGRNITLFCRNPYGARVYLGTGLISGGANSVQMSDGDAISATVVNDSEDAGAYRWQLVLLPRFDRETSFKELTVTESYSLLTGFPYKNFSVSGQAAGNAAVVTLPEITDDIVGMELKGFHIGAEGDLRFTRSGTDLILMADGSTGTSIDLTDSPGTAVGTLTALPSVSSVYYWGASFDG